MYELRYTPPALKQLERLEKQTQDRILKALERARIKPQDFLERLVGDAMYKLRVGDYRIIIDLDEGILVILVVKIAKREDVYKR